MTLGAVESDESGTACPSGRRRKLRPLVITMGGARQESMEKLFESMSEDFEPPVFSPGIPSRSLRSRIEFLRIAHEVGLVPDEEWQAVEAAQHVPEYKLHPNRMFECLDDIPVTPRREGSEQDVKLHFAVELWQKAKALSRGRATMACLLAHLRAMKTCVQEGYDMILEDNVRAVPEECAKRIWETMDASEQCQEVNGEKCHLRYYGWLGSLQNLHWVLDTHAKRTNFSIERVNADTQEDDCPPASVFPFPVTEDFDLSPEDSASIIAEDDPQLGLPHQPPAGHQTPGGTPIWGAYAYWMSELGLEKLLNTLRMDVGAMLWKGKRMRTYVVKPIDKVLPRRVIESLGRSCIHVSTRPAFFRAPMLTSTIHAQWDTQFCESTEYQMQRNVLSWADLWLSDIERRIVHIHGKTGEWLTMEAVEELESEAGDQ